MVLVFGYLNNLCFPNMVRALPYKHWYTQHFRKWLFLDKSEDLFWNARRCVYMQVSKYMIQILGLKQRFVFTNNKTRLFYLGKCVGLKSDDASKFLLSRIGSKNNKVRTCFLPGKFSHINSQTNLGSISICILSLLTYHVC